MSYDSDVVSATGGVGEANWDKIIKLCNRIRDSVGPTSMHQAMQSVMKRVSHSNAAIQLHALTLLEACVSNCGQDFQKELTTQFFQNEVKNILLASHSDPRVTHRLKELLLSWSSEFKSASHMKELQKFMEQLRRDGVNFSGPPPPSSSTITPFTSHTTSTPSQNTQSREDEDLKKAIQLSLRDNPGPSSSSGTTLSSLSALSSAVRPAKKEARKVRAIYDFQAAEDNELSFRAGEVITLLDDSDENWWRGETQLSDGLFPASFVSKNLNKDPEPSKQEKKSKKKARSEVGVVKNGAGPVVRNSSEGVVNEQKVDLLLDMLKSADVTDTSREENKTVKQLESEVQAMRPAVEQTIQQLTTQEEAMQNVSSEFNEALALYRKLLAEGPKLSDITQPSLVQSYSHTMQHGMTTSESPAVNNVQTQPQSGIGTQQFNQNGIATQPQQNGMQHFHTTIQPHLGMGVQMQHGIAPRPGMGTQPMLNTGLGTQQNGMALPRQNGTRTQNLSTQYSSIPNHYTMPIESVNSDMSLQAPPSSLQYQPLTMIQPTQQQQQQQHHQQQQQHSLYAPPSYQPPVSMTTQPLPQSQPVLPPTSFPTYHTQHTQILPQPLL